MNQCSPRILSPYGVTRSRGLNVNSSSKWIWCMEGMITYPIYLFWCYIWRHRLRHKISNWNQWTCFFNAFLLIQFVTKAIPRNVLWVHRSYQIPLLSAVWWTIVATLIWGNVSYKMLPVVKVSMFSWFQCIDGTFPRIEMNPLVFITYMYPEHRVSPQPSYPAPHSWHGHPHDPD